MKRLAEEDRHFFALARQSVTANPFSDDRAAIDMEISGVVCGASDEERLAQTIAEVARRLDRQRGTYKAVARTTGLAGGR